LLLQADMSDIMPFIPNFGVNKYIISVWNNHAYDRPGRINSAVGKHISSPRSPVGRVKISYEKNLEVLNLLIVMVTKCSGLVGLWQGYQILQQASPVCPANFTASFKHCIHNTYISGSFMTFN
jgi:hypothetical protein